MKSACLLGLSQLGLAVLVLTSVLGCAQERNIVVQNSTSHAARVALVIGNASYKEAPIASAANDAADMAQALRETGFKVILRTDVNQLEMRQAIREFSDDLRHARAGLVFFAGHGTWLKGSNYLIPVGETIETETHVTERGVGADDILRTMEHAGVDVFLLILDACRNNPFNFSLGSASRGLAQMNVRSGGLVAFATSPGSTVADVSGRNSVYTKHLLSSLKIETDIQKIMQKTRAGVIKETGGRQIPWEMTSLMHDFHLRSPVEAATPDQVTR